jgi:Rod binding domain-containing protein
MQLTGVNGAQGTAQGHNTKQVSQAVADFEALLISNMLKAVRESEAEGWMGTGSDEAAATAMGMAEEQLAQAIAARGGLGLGRMISEQVTRKE